MIENQIEIRLMKEMMMKEFPLQCVFLQSHYVQHKILREVSLRDLCLVKSMHKRGSAISSDKV